MTVAVDGPAIPPSRGIEPAGAVASHRPRVRVRPAVAVVAAIGLAIVGWLTSEVAMSPTDTYVYLAAGERLQAGHDLYAISPGDREIGLNPPYWTVPTLSPPLLAVLWRPLATLGIPGMFLGWAMALVAYLIALAYVARNAPGWAIVATAALAPFIGWQLGLGNVNGFLALGIVGLWILRDRPWLAGLIVALMISVKVTPIILAVWFLTSGRYRALGATAVWMAVLLAVSIAGAGLGAHVDYLGVMTHTVSDGSSRWSIAGILAALGLASGVARYAPWLVLAAGTGAMLLLRSRDRITFALAVLLLVFASPAFQHYWLALVPMVLVVAPAAPRASGVDASGGAEPVPAPAGA